MNDRDLRLGWLDFWSTTGGTMVLGTTIALIAAAVSPGLVSDRPHAYRSLLWQLLSIVVTFWVVTRVIRRQLRRRLKTAGRLIRWVPPNFQSGRATAESSLSLPLAAALLILWIVIAASPIAADFRFSEITAWTTKCIHMVSAAFFLLLIYLPFVLHRLQYLGVGSTGLCYALKVYPWEIVRVDANDPTSGEYLLRAGLVSEKPFELLVSEDVLKELSCPIAASSKKAVDPFRSGD